MKIKKDYAKIVQVGAGTIKKIKYQRVLVARNVPVASTKLKPRRYRILAKLVDKEHMQYLTRRLPAPIAFQGCSKSLQPPPSTIVNIVHRGRNIPALAYVQLAALENIKSRTQGCQ